MLSLTHFAMLSEGPILHTSNASAKNNYGNLLIINDICKKASV